MKIYDIRWRTRDIAIVLRYTNQYWVSGFNVNHVSKAYVSSPEQEAEIARMKDEGWITVLNVEEREGEDSQHKD